MWHEHFSSLFAADDIDDDDSMGSYPEDAPTDEVQDILFSSPITESEIITAVRKLNVNKASGGILVPQHFVFGLNKLLPYMIKLFNRLFMNGEFPDKLGYVHYYSYL